MAGHQGRLISPSSPMYLHHHSVSYMLRLVPYHEPGRLVSSKGFPTSQHSVGHERCCCQTHARREFPPALSACAPRFWDGIAVRQAVIFRRACSIRINALRSQLRPQAGLQRWQQIGCPVPLGQANLDTILQHSDIG